MHTTQETKTVIFQGKEIKAHLPQFLSEGWQIRATQDASGIAGYEVGAQQITLVKDFPLPKKEEDSPQ